MVDFLDIYQQTKISKNTITANKAVSKASGFEGKIKELTKKVERLSLASQALWKLLRDHTDFEDEHIVAKTLDYIPEGAEAHAAECMDFANAIVNGKRRFC